MKLAVERKFSQVSPGTKSIGFGIKASAKAFKIISSGIYSDKIRAVIRELSTNAYDSHVSNGNASEPFQVHLPTYMTPDFSVRDFGTGLSPEALGLIEGVPGIYTTYFDSDKTDSNDVTGCLGLGSKSPFSYADNFLVESFIDGKKYMCSAHLNERGEPTITLLGECDTTERNGLKVTISVQSSDFHNFIYKAVEVYKNFPVKPTMMGAAISYPVEEIVAEGTDWKLMKGNSHSVAIMGNVEYPITADNTEFSQEDKKVINCNFRFTFKLGELDFDAGRESLGYDKRTIAAIKQRCALVVDEISDRFKDCFKDCKNVWEARKYYVYLKTKLDALSQILKIPNEFKGVQLFVNEWNRNVAFGHIKDMDKVIYSCLSYSNKIRENAVSSIDMADEKFIFVDNDIAKGAVVRCKQYIVDSSRGMSYDRKKVILLKFNTPQAKIEFLDVMGFDESYITLASTLSSPAKKARGVFAGVKLEKICRYNTAKSGHRNSRDHWENISKDIKDGGTYVELNRNYVMIDGKHVHAELVTGIITGLGFFGGTTAEVFGVKSALIERVKKMSQWTDLKEEVKAILVAHPEYETIFKVYSNMCNMGGYDRKCLQYIKDLKGINNSPDIKALLDILADLESLGDKAEDTIDTFRTLHTFVYGRESLNKLESNVDNPLDKAFQNVIIKYPLLTFCRHAGSEEETHFVNYVNQVDKETV